MDIDKMPEELHAEIRNRRSMEALAEGLEGRPRRLEVLATLAA